MDLIMKIYTIIFRLVITYGIIAPFIFIVVCCLVIGILLWYNNKRNNHTSKWPVFDRLSKNANKNIVKSSPYTINVDGNGPKIKKNHVKQTQKKFEANTNPAISHKSTKPMGGVIGQLKKNFEA